MELETQPLLTLNDRGPSYDKRTSFSEKVSLNMAAFAPS